MKVLAAIAVCFALLAPPAVAWSSPMPPSWHAPSWWLPGALCVHSHESGDWHISNPPYGNGFQFMLGTWVEAGGSPLTWVTASPREQLYRTFVIWRKRGTWLHDWPNTGRACGLR